MRYLADPPAARRGLSRDGFVILYHRPSGQTHLLTPLAAALVEVLADDPADIDEALRRLAAAHDLDGDGDGDDDPRAVIAARLDELAAAGLIRPA